MDGIQTGQSAAERRITAQVQDLTLRNKDLEPISGLVAYRPPRINLFHSGFEINFFFIRNYSPLYRGYRK